MQAGSNTCNNSGRPPLPREKSVETEHCFDPDANQANLSGHQISGQRKDSYKCMFTLLHTPDQPCILHAAIAVT